jgi:DNA processing protein
MAYTMEERCRIWLSRADMASRKMGKLLEIYGSAQAVWETFAPEMEKALGPQTYRVLKEYHDEASLEQIVCSMDEKRVRALFPGDGLYPPLLENIYCPPPILYTMGDPAILHGKAIALVGTRTPSRYGQDLAFTLGKELGQNGVTVVSGFARGIDTAAHSGCLQGGGKTAAVLGCGLDIMYPPENTEFFKNVLEGGGLFLSEYPLGSKPANYHFPDRNRILSGVSGGVALVEGRLKSGGMITVGHALEQGREVFALPGPVNREGSEAPHKLLREGARLVTCGKDILEDMGWLTLDKPTARKEPETLLSPGQEKVIPLLRREDLNFEELALKLAMDTASLNSLLTIMELAGIIKKSAGNLYSLADNSF